MAAVCYRRGIVALIVLLSNQLYVSYCFRGPAFGNNLNDFDRGDFGDTGGDGGRGAVVNDRGVHGAGVRGGNAFDIGDRNQNRNPVGREPHVAESVADPVRAGQTKQAARIAEHPACAPDVKRLCPESIRTNNFAVLECLQDDKPEDTDLSSECHSYLWHYKLNITKDIRFDSVVADACKIPATQVEECRTLPKDSGLLISCLLSNKDEITLPKCKQFLERLGTVMFSDYRLIKGFYDECANDVLKLECGSIDTGNDQAMHSQGSVINCLERKVDKLTRSCRKQVLRVAEFSANDYHSDRALYFACRDDRERLCATVTSGDGRVYQCLMSKKFDPIMSMDCRAKLTTRQKLEVQDYKVSATLRKSCDRDIQRFKCDKELPDEESAHLAFIILCIEENYHAGKAIDGKCRGEILDHRRMLMKDYELNPNIVLKCKTEIERDCEGLRKQGETLHCLMRLGRSHKVNQNCFEAIEFLIREVDAGEDFRVDAILFAACQPVADSVCKDKQPGESEVLSCLMNNVRSSAMTPACEERLMELQYFVSREFSLDSRLFKKCYEDAKKLCKVIDWNKQSNIAPGYVVSCLHRHRKNPDQAKRLSQKCNSELTRVMRQRAVDYRLNPDVEIPCMSDLGRYCSDTKIQKGYEISCLQDNFKELDKVCQQGITNFTMMEGEDVQINKVLYDACLPMMKAHCPDLLMSEVDEGEMMECLVEHKNDIGMHEKCRVGIEHFQLVRMQDYRFTFKFKESCKDDVVKLCSNIKNKADVVSCLSELVKNDTLTSDDQRVSKKCRDQLKVELLERFEDIRLDPELEQSCQSDIATHCLDVRPDNAEMLECLKDHKQSLSQTCHLKIFNRQLEEMNDITIDYQLMTICKNMIKKFCPNTAPEDMFNCLKDFKDEDNMDYKCHAIIAKRQMVQNTDYRMNPQLWRFCRKDIKEFCNDIVQSNRGKYEMEGLVIECLKTEFRLNKLSSTCEKEVRVVIKESAMDYRLDPVLAKACKIDIEELCVEELDDLGTGKVEECLKRKLQAGKITSQKCKVEIARTLSEGKADIQVDPQLHKACALDVKHYCSGIPPGQGRLMSCLLSAREDKEYRLDAECFRVLNDRVEMWEYAAKVAPPETVEDLMVQISDSPSRNYFLMVITCIFAFIFIGGLMFGRMTKRVRQEFKNR